jgi:wyosine [tRNA(Phe)-imidazoG37] synthetase (radical SAM superfamily)
VPPKTCSYGCVYCQIGVSSQRETIPRSFFSPEKVFKAVSQRVQALRAAEERIDYLTFVPDGEPTLDRALGREIRLLRMLGLPIAVITNASLLWKEPVRAAVLLADWVSVKVDAADEATWRRINRPHPFLEMDRILDGIRTFASEFTGCLTTETMLVAGSNDQADRVAEVAAYISGLPVTTSYISVPTRPPALPVVRPPSAQSLNQAFQILSRHVPEVEMLIGYEGDEFTSAGDVGGDLLSICAVHPMRQSAVEALLAQTGATWSTVEQLLQQGLLIETDFGGNRFYLRPVTAGGPSRQNGDEAGIPVDG